MLIKFKIKDKTRITSGAFRVSNILGGTDVIGNPYIYRDKNVDIYNSRQSFFSNDFTVFSINFCEMSSSSIGYIGLLSDHKNRIDFIINRIINTNNNRYDIGWYDQESENSMRILYAIGELSIKRFKR